MEVTSSGILASSVDNLTELASVISYFNKCFPNHSTTLCTLFTVSRLWHTFKMTLYCYFNTTNTKLPDPWSPLSIAKLSTYITPCNAYSCIANGKDSWGMCSAPTIAEKRCSHTVHTETEKWGRKTNSRPIRYYKKVWAWQLRILGPPSILLLSQTNLFVLWNFGPIW